MSLIEWNVDFYTGLPEVDRQHNTLVALVNRLSQASEAEPEVSPDFRLRGNDGKDYRVTSALRNDSLLRLLE